MKIYFTSTPRGKKEFSQNFASIHQVIEKLSHQHVHDFINQTDDYYYSSNHQLLTSHYKNSLANLKKADVAVFEASTHSLGVGFLINKALEFNKPTIVLYVSGRRPVLLEGAENDRLQMIEYHLKNLEPVLKEALEIAQENLDIRFNFFISPRHDRFLNWIATAKKLPRAVYLRRLIDQDIKKYKDFPG